MRSVAPPSFSLCTAPNCIPLSPAGSVSYSLPPHRVHLPCFCLSQSLLGSQTGLPVFLLQSTDGLTFFPFLNASVIPQIKTTTTNPPFQQLLALLIFCFLVCIRGIGEDWKIPNILCGTSIWKHFHDEMFVMKYFAHPNLSLLTKFLEGELLEVL